MNQQFQVQVPIGNLPINLVLVGNREYGQIVLIKVADFEEFDITGEVAAKVGNSIVLKSSEGSGTFNYNTLYDYKQLPLLLKWLQQLNLREPNGIFG